MGHRNFFGDSVAGTLIRLVLLSIVVGIICSALGINPGNYDYAVIAEFDDRQGYLEYRDHPDHKAFIAAYTADFVAERAAIQTEI